MATLSLCMIVKNEQDVLARCLSCIKNIADEIIIVDTGSTDSTKEIAKDFSNCIYDFPWCDDFAKARNFSFSKATMDYVMWLDADDIITNKNQELLLSLKNTSMSDADVIMMKYDVAFDEQGNATFSYYRERIFRRSLSFEWLGEIHEVVPLRGVVTYSDISVCHKKQRPNEPQRNLKIFEKLIARGEILEPRKQYYYARELYYNGRYEDAISQFNAFLAEKKGWIENNIDACKALAACHYKINQPDQALESLLKSLSFDKPRAEICCEIGKHFFSLQSYLIAAYWYETALACGRNDKSGGFYLPDCYGYIPYMQLCVCYDKLGDLKKAQAYNEKAGEIKPEDKGYLYNKAYFASLSDGA